MNCSICGNPNPMVPIYSADGTFLKMLCNQCSQIPKQCGLCEHGQTCSFQSDPSPIPKVIVETVQKGQMTMQRQVKNPSRIEVTCHKGCPCFSEEFGCLKENGICGSYIERT